MTRDMELERYANPTEECWICGDTEHEPSAHGDALVLRDWSVRDAVSMTDVAITDAMTLAQVARKDDAFAKLVTIYDEFHGHGADLDAIRASLWDGDIDAGEFLSDVESILADVGFYAFSDADAGSWFVFGPAVVITEVRS